MIPWIGLIGLLISIFSPAVGTLFIIPTSGKMLYEKKQANLHFFFIWVTASIITWFLGIINHIQLINIVFGVGLSIFLVFEFLKKKFNIDIIFMILLFYNSLFMLIRQLIFAKTIFADYKRSVDEAIKILSSRFDDNPEQFQLFMDMVEITKEFYLKYSPGIWIGTFLLCLMIAYYFFSKGYFQINILKKYRTNVFVIYTFVIALALTVINPTKIIAINYLIALVPLFFIQGIAIIQKKIGYWFLLSKILLIIAIFSLILNPYLVLFISVIGLFDNWFDFRNLSQLEDSHENNSN